MAEGPPPHGRRDEVESSFGHGRREHRRHQRSNCNIPVRLWRIGDEHGRYAIVRNLSESGAFLETDPLPVGTRLRLRFSTGSDERAAEVVWLEDPGPSTRVRRIRGVGVRFVAAAQVSAT